MGIDFLITFSVSFANFLLGLTVWLRDSRQYINRVFSFLVFAIVWWTIANFVADHSTGDLALNATRFTMLGGVLVVFAATVLSYGFPRKYDFSHAFYNKFQKWVALAIGGLSLTPLIVASVAVGPAGLEIEYGLLYPLYVLYLLQAIAVVAINFTRQFRRPTLAYQRSQLTMIIVGFLIYAGAAILTNIAIPLLTGDWASSKFGPIFSLIFVAMVSYAIIKHRLFDVRLAVVRTVAYFLSLITLAGLYIAAVHLVSLVLDMPTASSSTLMINAVIALLLAFILSPVKHFFDKITSAIFYQDHYDIEQFYSQFSNSLSRTTDIHDLLEDTAKLIETTLKSEHAFFYITYEGKAIRNGSHQAGRIGVELRGLLADYVKNYASGIIVTAEVDQGSELYGHLTKNRIALTLPLVNKDNLTGYLFLRPRKAGRYSGRDTRTLETVLDQLVVAIQRALSVQEVQDMNRTLHDKIADATKELRASNKKLQRLDAAKDEFVSMASHQLRTPLTSVKGYISMVLEGDVGQITKQQRKVLEEAFTSSERMVHLISDFLNVSRLQTGKFMIEKRPTNLANLVQEEVDSLRATANLHNLQLAYKKPSGLPILMVDENKIRQVIMNFIDNAIYYSKAETTIQVVLTKSDGDVLLEVKDTGIGVPKDEQAHLFTKFFRATNARKQRPDGTGVGLFLARRVIMDHGGRIMFSSVEGKGSIFGFRLPIIQLEALTATSQTEELKDKPGK